jgi:tetraacyldisaccharide 4'-kinase
MEWEGLRRLLWPFAVVYEIGARLRVSWYESGLPERKRLNGTVLSVGNLTVGGTGKTPMVVWLAEKLIAEGRRPAILTRGYRSANRVDTHGGQPADEVALLKARLGAQVQLGVGTDRYATGSTLERHGANWFILDDGFQHLRLKRQADIVLIDASDPFGGGMLPMGRSREPRGALRRADVVVITRSSHSPALEEVVHRHTNAPIFYAVTELDAVLRLPALTVQWPLAEHGGAKVFAFCGIGNSRAFFDDLRRWGFSIAGERSFRDHHRYSAAEVASLEQAAVSAGAEAMICTEKDAYNLRDAPPVNLPIYACRIRLALLDPRSFWGAIIAAVSRNRALECR